MSPAVTILAIAGATVLGFLTLVAFGSAVGHYLHSLGDDAFHQELNEHSARQWVNRHGR